MTDYAVHEPKFSDTTTAEWDEPELEDFDTDDLDEVGEHFICSSSGFPPENFTDLKLPVVDPDENLNKNALQTAKSGGHGVGAIDDLDDDKRDRIEGMIDDLANENFEDADFGE
ncbi:hypothetical protein [Natrinema gelatinilyticum]|uniref:hypothetical protein n=1 Tax=Natrinema gelatinilyticum TaxID=2961571 RepID=UPI0020C51B92|nr:hypothetical protein [Natrinema gelatinilyticum]